MCYVHTTLCYFQKYINLSYGVSRISSKLSLSHGSPARNEIHPVKYPTKKSQVGKHMTLSSLNKYVIIMYT